MNAPGKVVLRLAAACSLGVAMVPAQSGPVRVTTTQELRAALAKAGPGTTIAMAKGRYDGFTAAGLTGTTEAPIVVRAEDHAEPPHVTGGIHLSDVAHFELDGLLVSGAPANGINIDDGGSFATPAHHVVLRRLTVRDCGGAGNHDGLKLSGLVDFAVHDCTIERWGRGGSAIDMVGCRNGLLDGCTIRDRQEAPAANGVQMKGGTRDVVVRRCHFEHAGQRAVQLGGSTGMAFFRPAPAGFEAKDLVVEHCTFVGAAAAVAFVGCDGAIVRHNTLYRPTRWALRILQETRDAGFVPCRNGAFTDNLIVYRGLDPLVNVGPDTAPASFTFARNYWFREDAPGRSLPQLPSPERDPAGGRDPALRDPATGDLGLRPGSPAKGHGAEPPPNGSR